MNRLKLFSGTSNADFANKVASFMGIELSQCDISRFADGEVQVEIHERPGLGQEVVYRCFAETISTKNFPIQEPVEDLKEKRPLRVSRVAKVPIS